MAFSVAADLVLDGCWAVVDERGAVVRRADRTGKRLALRPAVFRTRDEALACADRWNAHLPLVVND